MSNGVPGIRCGRTSQCGGDEVVGGRDLSLWHYLMTAFFPQVALLPDWHGGSRYQLALCEYNKVWLRETPRYLNTTFL